MADKGLAAILIRDLTPYLCGSQDWHVCELSQAGISSRAYTPGPYSNREDLLYAFDRMVVGLHGRGRRA